MKEMQDKEFIQDMIAYVGPEGMEFAERIVRFVRDGAILECDARLMPQAKYASAMRWKSLGVPESAIKEVIPDIVDTTLFLLINAIDLGELHLKYVSSNGREVDLTRKADGGHLAGFYAGNAWTRLFSKERFNDD